MTIQVLNGPNLGRLGKREAAVYGSVTYAELVSLIEAEAAVLGVDVQVRQSDSEAELLGWVHDAADAKDPVILNAGAFTHTSVALRDACAELSAGLIEVHISNVHAREEFRHHSYLSALATGVIVGLGVRAIYWPCATSWRLPLPEPPGTRRYRTAAARRVPCACGPPVAGPRRHRPWPAQRPAVRRTPRWW